jgi:CheY-like chemotaxis protein
MSVAAMPGVGMYPEEQGILVVDDDAARRRRIAQILAGDNFVVTVASEGLTALRKLGERRFALIISALQLPGSLDGPATLRQARLRQPWLKALFIDEGRSPIPIDPDRDDFITSPVERWQLLGCVFEMLQRIPATGLPDLACRVRTELRAS